MIFIDILVVKQDPRSQQPVDAHPGSSSRGIRSQEAITIDHYQSADGAFRWRYAGYAGISLGLYINKLGRISLPIRIHDYQPGLSFPARGSIKGYQLGGGISVYVLYLQAIYEYPYPHLEIGTFNLNALLTFCRNYVRLHTVNNRPLVFVHQYETKHILFPDGITVVTGIFHRIRDFQMGGIETILAHLDTRGNADYYPVTYFLASRAINYRGTVENLHAGPRVTFPRIAGIFDKYIISIFSFPFKGNGSP